nr:hypothetical protein Iba_chr05aCG5110 [Ipomoea batatas]GMC93665.1 hypothetical protein Iba_chr05bCG4550 [Ipomoea batatas]GMC97514.1 hypothetical protein Iba_chr05dCG7740 [Ipomoea batatas]GMD41460.1 hypothetical protein Iba_scaffold107732CG0010 [Ipomoea batatas]
MAANSCSYCLRMMITLALILVIWVVVNSPETTMEKLKVETNLAGGANGEVSAMLSEAEKPRRKLLGGKPVPPSGPSKGGH